MKGIDNEKFTIMKCDTKLVDIEMNYAFGKLINYTVYKECPDFIRKCICDFDDETVVYGALIEWLRSRTIPDERVHRDCIIKKVYGLNPNFTSWLTLLTVDHGVSVMDDFWIKFSGEDIEYADIRVKH